MNNNDFISIEKALIPQLANVNNIEKKVPS